MLPELKILVEPSFSAQYVERTIDRDHTPRTILSQSIFRKCSYITASFVISPSMAGTSFMSITINSIRNKYLVSFVGFPQPKSHDDFKNFVSKDDSGNHYCIICNAFKHKSCSNVVNHIESKHFPNSFVYTCKYCVKQFNARNSLNVHVSKCKNEQRIFD